MRSRCSFREGVATRSPHAAGCGVPGGEGAGPATAPAAACAGVQLPSRQASPRAPPGSVAGLNARCRAPAKRRRTSARNASFADRGRSRSRARASEGYMGGTGAYPAVLGRTSTRAGPGWVRGTKALRGRGGAGTGTSRAGDGASRGCAGEAQLAGVGGGLHRSDCGGAAAGAGPATEAVAVAVAEARAGAGAGGGSSTWTRSPAEEAPPLAGAWPPHGGGLRLADGLRVPLRRAELLRRGVERLRGPESLRGRGDRLRDAAGLSRGERLRRGDGLRCGDGLRGRDGLRCPSCRLSSDALRCGARAS